jgi:uncharacterized membrane protein
MPNPLAGSGAPGLRLRTNRLEAFSDGVFAIAITLLVLELGVPQSSVDDPMGAIAAEWPSYVAYLVSFASVGAIWLEHNTITEHLRNTDTVFIRLNLLLLLVVSFLPFPTGLLSQYHGHLGAERVAVTLYGVTLFAASVMISVLWHHAMREQLVREDLDAADALTLSRRLNPSLIAYVVLIGTGLLVPRVALFGYLGIAVFLIVPFELFRRHRTGQA